MTDPVLMEGYQWAPEEDGAELDPNLRIQILPSPIREKEVREWITFYNETTGAIRASVSLDPAFDATIIPAGEDFIRGEEYIDDGLFYIDPVTKIVTPKKVFTDVITVTDNNIDGLPNPTRCFYYNTDSTETDGNLEIVVANEEYITVTLCSDLYIPYTLELHCVPS